MQSGSSTISFGVIGYGNLGRAVASALVCTGLVNSQDIHVCDMSKEALSLAGKEHFTVYTPDDINLLIDSSDVICLVVKSYVFEQLAASIDSSRLKGKLIISFMAGVPAGRIAELLGNPESAGIARAMPSLAIAKNEGVIAYTRLPPAVSSIFSKFGYAFEAEPEEIEKVMAFASCGLGFAAYLIDAFKSAGEAMGFPPDTAAHIAALTYRNACDAFFSAAPADSPEDAFRATVKAVATPGGATEQGIKHMDSSGVYKIVNEAVRKAYDKMKI